jgi:host factor-I protein
LFCADNNNKDKELTMTRNEQLQHAFLEELRQQQVQVSIFLINGIKLHGVIDNMDDSVVMLKNTITQMVFKHAISTVVPAKMITV